MSITVKEIMNMKGFESFSLVSGDNGLGKEITNLGVLDYEYANSDPQLEATWTFGKQAFVISSLLFAKDHPERIISAVKGLCRDGVSALAVKMIYYNELPQEVLDYSNQHSFPIFMFGRDDAYFENILIVLNSKITESDNAELVEQKIHLLLSKTLTFTNILTLSSELIPDAPVSFCAVRIMPTHYSLAVNYNHINSIIQNSLSPKDYLFKYINGYIVILNMEKEKEGDNLKNILQRRIRFFMPGFVIGIGNVHKTMGELNFALEECIHAAQYGAAKNMNCVAFYELGIYKILMPYSSDYWMKTYCQEILEPIITYDRKYCGDLFLTAQLYVKFRGDTAKVSTELHLHKNSVRYRIKKIKELLNYDEDINIDDQLSIAFRVYDIQNGSPNV